MKFHVHNLLALGLATAVIVSAPALAAAAPQPSDDQGLAKGRLIHADGTAAAGVTVTIYAHPVETAEQHLAVGESAKLTALAQVHTDREGQYAIAVRRNQLAGVRDPGGNVNLELIARDASGDIALLSMGLAPEEPLPAGTARAVVRASRLTPVRVADLVVASPAETLTANSDPTPSAATADVAATADPATRFGDIDAPQAKEWTTPLSASDPFIHGTGASDPVASPSVTSCLWNYIADVGNKTVWVGGTYVATSYVTGDFQYSSGASSTLGVGVSSSGAYGSYSLSGSVTRSSSGSVDFPTSSGYQHDYTQFRYGKYAYYCDPWLTPVKYQVQARYWAGGASTRNCQNLWIGVSRGLLITS